MPLNFGWRERHRSGPAPAWIPAAALPRPVLDSPALRLPPAGASVRAAAVRQVHPPASCKSRRAGRPSSPRLRLPLNRRAVPRGRPVAPLSGQPPAPARSLSRPSRAPFRARRESLTCRCRSLPAPGMRVFARAPAGREGRPGTCNLLPLGPDNRAHLPRPAPRAFHLGHAGRFCLAGEAHAPLICQTRFLMPRGHRGRAAPCPISASLLGTRRLRAK